MWIWISFLRIVLKWVSKLFCGGSAFHLMWGPFTLSFGSSMVKYEDMVLLYSYIFRNHQGHPRDSWAAPHDGWCLDGGFQWFDCTMVHECTLAPVLSSLDRLGFWTTPALLLALSALKINPNGAWGSIWDAGNCILIMIKANEQKVRLTLYLLLCFPPPDSLMWGVEGIKFICLRIKMHIDE